MTATLAGTLAGQYGPVVARWRFTQVDRQNTTIADLTSAVIPNNGTLDLQNDRAVPATISLTLDAKALPASFTTAADGNFNIAPLYEVLVGGSWQNFQLGVFYLDRPTKAYLPGTRTWTAQGADLVSILARATTATAYVVPAGANYLGQVAVILANLGLAVASGFSGSQVTPVDFPWQPNTPWLTIINDLLLGINYYPIWANGTGQFTSAQRLDPATATVAATYTTQTEPVMIASQPYQTSASLSQFPNQFAVIIDDPARTQAFFQASNYDSTCPLSITSLGSVQRVEYRGGSSPGSKCLLDLPTAQDIASFELRTAAAMAQPATLATFIDPQRTNREHYSVTLVDAAGSTIESAQQFRVAGWSIPLAAGGSMIHSLGRASTVALSAP